LKNSWRDNKFRGKNLLGGPSKTSQKENSSPKEKSCLLSRPNRLWVKFPRRGSAANDKNNQSH
jgi:hypothetical protein